MQGKPLAEYLKTRIAKMLRDTELSMKEIARELRISTGPVRQINQMEHIRTYGGHKLKWR